MHLPPLLRALIPVITIGLAIGTLPGCAGYQLGPLRPAHLQHINTIAVPTAKNETLEPRIATNVTNHIIKAFHNDGSYKLTTAENADARLDLVITDIDRRQLRSARFNTLRSRELAVRMTVHYELTESATGRRLSSGRVRHDTNIFLDPNFQTSERQAIDDVSRKVAADIVNRLSEGWPGEEDLTDPISQERYRLLRERLNESELENDAFDH